MSKTFIALVLSVFILSVVGCATNASVYKASKDEIVSYKSAPDDAIVVFPKNYKAPKNTDLTFNDTEMYLRYAKSMEKVNKKIVQRREEKKEAWEKRKKAWEKERKEYEEYLKKLEEENIDERTRVHTRWWRYSHNWRYVPYYWRGFYPIRSVFFNEWWDPCLPNTGHRAYLRAATSKQVLGSTGTPTTHGTTITNGKFTNPSETTGR